MDLHWTTGTNIGFTDETVGGKTITAVSKSNLVDAMIDQITGFTPQPNTSVVRDKATSLKWIYDYLLTHYGCIKGPSSHSNNTTEAPMTGAPMIGVPTRDLTQEQKLPYGGLTRRPPYGHPQIQRTTAASAKEIHNVDIMQAPTF